MSADHVQHEIIREVSFGVNAKEIVSVVGPSGSGKTTLIKCAAGLIRPSRGEVRFEGQRFAKVPKGVSIVFQDYSKSLFPWMNVIKNVAVGANCKSKEEALGRAKDALDKVGLRNSEKRYIFELSGGMAQRVAIARALVSDPSLLIMDEPFASVDALTKNHLQDVVADLWEKSNFAILMVTHDVNEAIYLSDRAVVLSARPSRIRQEIAVEIDRPRDQINTRATLQFARKTSELLSSIEEAGRDAIGAVGSLDLSS